MARRSRQGPSKSDFILGKRNYSFQGQVDEFIVNTEKKMMWVLKQSLFRTIDEAQKSVAKGGRMRVDTGFLRASGQASLNGMPSGPSVKPKNAIAGTFDDGSKSYPEVKATIKKLKFGSTLYYGWTANYARYREAYDGFLISAVQNWQQTVNVAVAEAKRRFG